MNEQDKKAYMDYLKSPQPWVSEMPQDQRTWQAALEYARGQQEPFTWAMEWWDKDGEYEVEYSTMGEFSFGRKNGFPLYRHPAQPVQPAEQAPNHIPGATKMVMVTDLEMLDMYCEPNSDKEMFEFGRAVQKRFIEKNGLNHDK